MANKALFLVLFVFLSITAIAQKQLTNAEAQSFYSLIKQTKEYKAVKSRTDSSNAVAGTEIPQEVVLEILKGDQHAPEDDITFRAAMERRLAIGVSLERYIFQYDKLRNQIVSVNKQSDVGMNIILK